MASLLRKARSRRRDAGPGEGGDAPALVREGVVVAAQESYEQTPSLGSSRHGVGSQLRDSREQRGLDIEGVGRALRIRHPYIVAIEEGRYQDLPSGPYAVGFVRSYSEFLGLDGAEMVRRFREEAGGIGPRAELKFPEPVSEGSFPAALLIGIVIILAAVVYGVWYFYQWRHGGSAESVSELPSRLSALIHPAGGEDQPANSGSSSISVTPSQASAAAVSNDAATAPASFQTNQPDPAPVASAKPAATKPAASAAPAAADTPAPVPAATPAPAVAPAPAPTPEPQAAAPAASQPQPAAPAQQPAPAPAPVAATPAPATPPAAQPVADNAAPADAPKVVADASPPPATAAPQTSVSPPPAPDLASPSRVVLRATDDCWIEIRDPTGAMVLSRMMHRGDTLPVPPQPGLSLTIGNAGALTLLLDGSALPPLGKSGMVRHDIPLDPERLGGPPNGAGNTPSLPATPPAAQPANG